jgi:hypothetical protein
MSTFETEATAYLRVRNSPGVARRLPKASFGDRESVLEVLELVGGDDDRHANVVSLRCSSVRTSTGNASGSGCDGALAGFERGADQHLERDARDHRQPLGLPPVAAVRAEISRSARTSWGWRTSSWMASPPPMLYPTTSASAIPRCATRAAASAIPRYVSGRFGTRRITRSIVIAGMSEHGLQS